MVVGGCVFYRVRKPPALSAAREAVPRFRGVSLIAAVPALLGAAMISISSLAALSVAVKGQLYSGYLDSFDFWIPKAETIYYAHGLDPGVWSTIHHPEYPPLVAVMDALTFHFVGGFHPSVLPFQTTLLGGAFLLSALALVDRVAFGQTLAWIQVLGAVLILLAAAGVNLGWGIVPQQRLSST